MVDSALAIIVKFSIISAIWHNTKNGTVLLWHKCLYFIMV